MKEGDEHLGSAGHAQTCLPLTILHFLAAAAAGGGRCTTAGFGGGAARMTGLGAGADRITGLGGVEMVVVVVFFNVVGFGPGPGGGGEIVVVVVVFFSVDGLGPGPGPGGDVVVVVVVVVTPGLGPGPGKILGAPLGVPISGVAVVVVVIVVAVCAELVVAVATDVWVRIEVPVSLLSMDTCAAPVLSGITLIFTTSKTPSIPELSALMLPFKGSIAAAL